jgi:isopentenyl-diphosphate Delta-isomerase
MEMQNLIALTDSNDVVYGFKDKIEVHQQGLLHRAFSIFVFNDDNKLLLQRRALNKYHSGGLWTNTCCSHQVFGEDFQTTLHRRLIEEMGFDCDLIKSFTFHYHAGMDNSLIENELDHVYIGYYNGSPKPDPNEVCDWRWVSINEIEDELNNDRNRFTYWFNVAFRKIMQHAEIPVKV